MDDDCIVIEESPTHSPLRPSTAQQSVYEGTSTPVRQSVARQEGAIRNVNNGPELTTISPEGNGSINLHRMTSGATFINLTVSPSDDPSTVCLRNLPPNEVRDARGTPSQVNQRPGIITDYDSSSSTQIGSQSNSAMSQYSPQVPISNVQGSSSISHQPSSEEQASEQVFLSDARTEPSPGDTGQTNSPPSMTSATAIAQTSSSVAALSDERVSVNAAVLSQVIELAARSCFMPSGGDAYQYLLSLLITVPPSSRPRSQVEGVNPPGQIQSNSDNTVSDSNIVMSQATNEVVNVNQPRPHSSPQPALVTQPDVLIVDEEHNRSHLSQTSPNTRAGVADESVSVSGNDSLILEDAFDLTLTESPNESLNDEMGQSTSQKACVLGKRTNKGTESVGKHPKKMAKFGVEKGDDETSCQTVSDPKQCQGSSSQEQRPSIVSMSEHPFRDTNSRVSVSAESASSSNPSQHDPSNFINLITEESPNVDEIQSFYSAQRSRSNEEKSNKSQNDNSSNLSEAASTCMSSTAEQPFRAHNPTSLSAESAGSSHSPLDNPSNFINLITEESPNVDALQLFYNAQRSNSNEENSNKSQNDNSSNFSEAASTCMSSTAEQPFRAHNSTSLSAESASSSHSPLDNPSNFINLITEDTPYVNVLQAINNASRFSDIEDNSSQHSQHPSLLRNNSDQGFSSDSSVDARAADSGSASNDGFRMRNKKRRRRCGQCVNCLIPNCNNCRYCLEKRHHSVCINKRKKPCLTWGAAEQPSSGIQVSPPSHPPSLQQLRVLPGTESEDESDEEFHTRLDKALEDGYVEIFTTKCGVSGPPGTGKSNFRALISGKDRPRQRQSTALATEADQIIPAACITHDFDEEMVEFHRNKGDLKVKWLVVGGKKLFQLISKTIHNQEKGNKHGTSSSSSSSLDSGQVVSVPKRTMSAIRKEIKKNLKALSKCKRKPKCLHKMKLLLIVDTGGQPQFQEIMPIFVRNSSMTLLVHKLNETLKDRPRFDYEINGVRYSVPDELLVTNQEYLEQSLRTICSCCFSRNISQLSPNRIPKPHFAIIGMFKDKCDEQMLEEKNKAVNECIKPFTQSRKCVALMPSRRVDNPVFAIDGSEQGWSNNSDVIDDIHTRIEAVTEGLGVKIPIRWFLFLDLLKDCSKRSPFLSLQRCYDIAKEEDILMDEKDVDEALVLFDELNLILYFPNILHEVVFCSPEFLYNKVSEIIAQSFDCCDASSGLTRQERMEFRKTGIFSKSLLERVRSLRSGFDEVLFKINDLLILLKKRCIIAEVSDDQFFIPCVLALQRKEDNSAWLLEIRSNMAYLGVQPLIISFPDGYSPRGLFCASVAHLAKLLNWVVDSPRIQLERKRNLIEFEYREVTKSDYQVQRAASLGRVVITDMVSHIEVYSTCDKEHLCEIRRAIYGALWHAANSLSYSPTDMEIDVGFACQVDCGVSEFHGTAVSYTQKTRKWSSKCIKNSSKRAKPLTDEEMCWFVSDMSDNTSGPSTSLVELQNEVATKTNKWESIALALDISHTDIERIKLDQLNRIEDCFVKVFEKWERQLNPAFTWPVIISALESPSVAEFRLASELRARHLHTISG